MTIDQGQHEPLAGNMTRDAATGKDFCYIVFVVLQNSRYLFQSTCLHHVLAACHVETREIAWGYLYSIQKIALSRDISKALCFHTEEGILIRFPSREKSEKMKIE